MVAEISTSVLVVWWPSLDLMVLDVHYPVLVPPYHQILSAEESSGSSIGGSAAGGNTPVVAETCNSPDVDVPLQQMISVDILGRRVQPCYRRNTEAVPVEVMWA